jgi:endo-1,4-beta-xylanase
MSGVLLVGLLGGVGLALQRAGQRTVQLGTAVSAQPLRENAAYRATLRANFSSITTENELKFEPVQPERGLFRFEDADAMLAFAEQHGMEVRGHTLVWHNQLPGWLREGQFTRDELIAILRDHITTVVSRYRGRIAAWDVVNEAFESDGSLRDSLWLRGIGPDYIEMALHWAHAADPDALLFINEFGIEHGGAKAAGLERTARELVRDGVPLHGVGFQMHLGLDNPPDPGVVDEQMRRFAALGLRTDITELEVAIQNGVGTHEERIAAQSELYSSIAEVCARQRACRSVTVWGVADSHSWLPEHTGRPDAPLLFDTNYQRKPSYDALLRELGSFLPESVQAQPGQTR